MRHAIVRTIFFASALFAVTTVLGPRLRAQTFTVLHSFTGGNDGSEPLAGLTLDSRGNLYGTTSSGGNPDADAGVVFKLANLSDSWTLTPLHIFGGTYLDGHDGGNPEGRVIFGPDSTLFGTTAYGGSPQCGCARPPLDCMGCGTVFSLRQPANVCRSTECLWAEDQLVAFGENGADGVYPSGDLLFDQAGDIFGAANLVYELTPLGGSWMETVLSRFGGSDGTGPNGGLVSDAAGNLYGTTYNGGSGNCNDGDGCGVVFKLTPSNGSWTETVLYSFTGANDGGNPSSGVIFDDAGNLYGATVGYGSGGGGTIFELSPSTGGWTFTVLYSFNGLHAYCGPGPLTFHNSSLYGTTYCDGANQAGNVFSLTPSSGSWTYTSLHEFTGGTDGGRPVSNVSFDSAENLYGTASSGGSGPCRCGVVWEVTP